MGIEGRALFWNDSWQRSAYRHHPSTTDRLPVFATLRGYSAFLLNERLGFLATSLQVLRILLPATKWSELPRKLVNS